MAPANTSENAGPRPRVGIPWRTTAEERQQNREKLDYSWTRLCCRGVQRMSILGGMGPLNTLKQRR